MSKEHWWTDTDRKTEVLIKTPECHFVLLFACIRIDLEQVVWDSRDRIYLAQ
jgi:hypothetical protein